MNRTNIAMGKEAVYKERLLAEKLCNHIDNALLAYEGATTDYDNISIEQALDLARKAFEEGNAVLITRCFNGVYLTVWRDKFK